MYMHIIQNRYDGWTKVRCFNILSKLLAPDQVIQLLHLKFFIFAWDVFHRLMLAVEQNLLPSTQSDQSIQLMVGHLGRWLDLTVQTRQQHRALKVHFLQPYTMLVIAYTGSAKQWYWITYTSAGIEVIKYFLSTAILTLLAYVTNHVFTMFFMSLFSSLTFIFESSFSFFLHQLYFLLF